MLWFQAVTLICPQLSNHQPPISHAQLLTDTQPPSGPGAAKVPLRVIASAIICRLLILPLLGTAIVIGGYAAGAYAAPDRIFLLVMLIQVRLNLIVGMSGPQRLGREGTILA